MPQNEMRQIEILCITKELLYSYVDYKECTGFIFRKYFFIKSTRGIYFFTFHISSFFFLFSLLSEF